ncbi:succinate--CoA ligase subunit alpha [Acidiferrimicrobium sp. IK]|uniref:succinate--CoA ligase subunit alpha n=1 Tax=Acidiferrimicrobium sp. IK TaxID=2871700 RepID=UPI0021CAEDF4|nr:succinate--CoA ligase subunit alpha [Acidiferrimicrobium sp. IK]MCU4183889.1 succinate--CoA ligase subunit alpha [Acidiferrimicrobium sp. IK]
MNPALLDSLDKDARVVIAGITGQYARDQTRTMVEFGMNVVAGAAPGRAGQVVWGVPVFDALAETADLCPTIAIVYVSAARVAAVAREAMDLGVKLLVIAAEGVPLHDTMRLRAEAVRRGCCIVGPNTVGLLRPGRCLAGSLVPDFARPGPVCVLSRSGTLSIQIVSLLSRSGIGQSLCVAVGGDRVVGSTPAEWLQVAEADPSTRAVVLIGEVGGQKEYQAAEVIETMSKPVVAYIAGRSAPQDTPMGHVGAVVREYRDTAAAKISALESAGATVSPTLWDVPGIVAGLLEEAR